jgi:ubiquinone/menaquinone biosynthesis C-methylase UbiE
MARSKAGGEAHLFATTDAEMRRLERRGARLYGEMAFLEPFLTPTLRDVLDAGCGSGYFTRRVAAALPSATVVGLDRDERRLAFARSQRSTGCVHYEPGDVGDMAFADDSFDLVFCRFVLVHDRDPNRGLREMARVARPGATVVAYDMVHEGVWFVPGRPAFEKLLRVVVDLLRDRGAEPNQGLYLASGMRRAGLTDVSIRVIAHHASASDELYAVHRDNWIATFESIADRLGPRLDAALVRAAVGELERVTGDELLVETTVLAYGTKP